jgi:hypothetical protein
MSKILSYLGRYVAVDDPQKTIEVFRGFQSINVSFSDLGDTQLDDMLKTSFQDIFEEGVWVQCANKAELDFRKNGLILKTPDGMYAEYRKR